MRALLAGQAVAIVLFTLIIPIEVIYAKESLGTTSAGYGVLLAAWGAGIVVGSLSTSASSSGRRSRWSWCRRSRSASPISAWRRRDPARRVPDLVVGGAGNGIQWIAVMTALQERTPPATRRGSAA